MTTKYSKSKLFEYIEGLNLDFKTYSDLILFIDYADETDPMTEVMLSGLGSLLENTMIQSAKGYTYDLLKASTDLYRVNKGRLKHDYDNIKHGVPLSPPLMPLSNEIASD